MEKLYSYVFYLHELWVGYGHPTDTNAALLQYGVILAFGSFVVGLWLAWAWYRRASLLIPLAATMLIPIALWANAYLSQSFKGTPDTRCAEYENGRLRFVLVGVPKIVPVRTDDEFGARMFVATVRAPTRWGDDVHLCTLSTNDLRVKWLVAIFQKLAKSPRFGDAAVGGLISFTFGFGMEIPNVIWIPDRAPENKGPPEKPSRRESA